ncbi:hypothetical protein BHM03_00038470 [Ensete ventricosum]|nr:hypothetical protein BHM03_00038470 [Ensete ventricosum]
MWAMSSLPYSTSHQPPVVRDTVRWSATASPLTRRPSPAVRVRGYCSPVDCCAYPDTPPVANCHGSGGTGQGRSSTSALLCRPLSGGIVNWPQDC